MLSLLCTLLFVFCAILVCVVVLIQEGKGGGLGGAFGGAGQQTFGVGTRGITRFTAGVVIVMLGSAIAANKLQPQSSTSITEEQGQSLMDAAEEPAEN